MSDPLFAEVPVAAVLPELLGHLAEQGGALLQAPPGAGKSTRVPLALLNTPWRGDARILVLEPRRVAARAVAGFMAELRDEPVGATVGYRTRSDSRVSAATRIEVVTEGVLTRLLLDDPALEGYAAVVFDEFHERSLQADLGLALVHEVRGALREDLRLLVMSATLEVEALAERLALPVVRSEGRAFPVTVSHAPPPRQGDPLDHCARQVTALAGSGTTLVFLPGVRDIERLRERLPGSPPVQVLHGRLDNDAQAALLAAPADGAARIVLATNVAETSVTIEGVTTVVDSGLERRPEYHPRRHRSRLLTRRISQASADQRAGRAGRLGPGRCVRLWPADEVLARHIEAEIRHTALDGLVLDLARWGCRDAAGLFWLDPPPTGAWQAARSRLQAAGAVDAAGAITEFGRRLSGLPLPPELAALVLLGRDRGRPRASAALAVLLNERAPGLDREPDLAQRLRRFLAAPRRWPVLDREWRRLAGERRDREHSDQLDGILADAFPDRLARRRHGDSGRYLLADGGGARLEPGDALAAHEWLLILDTDGHGRDGRVRLAWPLAPAMVETLLAGHARDEERVYWDEDRERVVAERVRAVGAIVLTRQPLTDPSPAQLQQGLLAALRRNGLALLPWNEATRQWRARVAWMHELEPDRWPAMDDDRLLAELERWLAPFLVGRRTLKDMQDVPLADALALLIDSDRRRRLERALPARCAVASGRSVAINYQAEGGPRLAVKLQECFGMENLPVLADGRLRLIAELLTPAGRPAAITGDLGRFWREGYAAVRKDLRGRYPKHPWPEDPLAAVATARTKRAQERR